MRIVRVHIFTRVAPPSCGDLAGWPRTRHHRFAQCGDLGRAEGGHLSEFARVGTGADRSRESIERIDEAALAVGSEQRVTVFGPARPARSTRRQIDGCIACEPGWHRILVDRSIDGLGAEMVEGVSFDLKRQIGELNAVVSSTASQTYLAESYTGWPVQELASSRPNQQRHD